MLVIQSVLQFYLFLTRRLRGYQALRRLLWILGDPVSPTVWKIVGAMAYCLCNLLVERKEREKGISKLCCSTI